MLQENVAPTRPVNGKSSAFKRSNEFFALDAGQARHMDTC
jgi:hypothetical protein